MDYRKLHILIKTQIDGIHLMALHGACCLALRHPKFTGPSRKLILEFIDKAEKALKEAGVLTENDIEEIHHEERQSSQHKDY